MKIVKLNMIELTRQEAAELDSEAQILIYNSITGKYELWMNEKHCPSHSKNDVSHLKFYLFTVSELPKA